MKPLKDAELHLRIDPDLKARAQAAAARDNRTLSDVVVLLLEAYISEGAAQRRESATRATVNKMLRGLKTE
jgi:antitoxin component of RelBE/YafQ-DinJ toxin-antitoxin module